MTDCIFCKIASGELQTALLYEDDEIIAFRDIDPQAPEHVLVIPRAHVETLLDVDESGLLGRLQSVAITVARDLKLDQSGFRLVTNCLEDGGQAVYHLHLHLLGGRAMGWPPG